MSYETKGKPNWCPGCGNYGIWEAFKIALNELKIKQENIVLASGIGCSSKIPHWIRVYAFNGLHGRALPLAQGIKIANPKLTVIACGGDGDGYAEGGNHFIHFCKKNIDVKYFVHDNQIYGLTKGQPSPTTDIGTITKVTPLGTIENSINPAVLAIALGATFVARGFAGDIKHLKELMKAAITHKGAAIIDILQPCVTFNKINTYKWFQERVYKVEKPAKTRIEGIKIAQEWGEKIPIGIIYQSNEPTYDEKIPLYSKPKKKKQAIKELLKELE